MAIDHDYIRALHAEGFLPAEQLQAHFDDGHLEAPQPAPDDCMTICRAFAAMTFLGAALWIAFFAALGRALGW